MEEILNDTSYVYRRILTGYAIMSICGEFTLTECGDSTRLRLIDYTETYPEEIEIAFRYFIRKYPLLRPAARITPICDFASRLFIDLGAPALLLDIEGAAVNWNIVDAYGFGKKFNFSLERYYYPLRIETPVESVRVSYPSDFTRLIKVYIRSKYDTLISTIIRESIFMPQAAEVSLEALLRYLKWRFCFQINSLQLSVSLRDEKICIEEKSTPLAIISNEFVVNLANVAHKFKPRRPEDICKIDEILSKDVDLAMILQQSREIAKCSENLSVGARNLLYK